MHTQLAGHCYRAIDVNISCPAARSPRFSDEVRFELYRIFYVCLIGFLNCVVHSAYKRIRWSENISSIYLHAFPKVANKWNTLVNEVSHFPMIADMIRDVHTYMIEKAAKWTTELQEFPACGLDQMMPSNSIHLIGFMLTASQHGASFLTELLKNDILMQNMHRCCPLLLFDIVMSLYHEEPRKYEIEDVLRYLNMFFTTGDHDIYHAMALITHNSSQCLANRDWVHFRYNVILNLRKSDFENADTSMYVMKPHATIYDEIDFLWEHLQEMLSSEKLDDLDFWLVSKQCPIVNEATPQSGLFQWMANKTGHVF